MREKERVTRVFFVRHGETDFPQDRIYCDFQEDPPLSDTGARQAQVAASTLADVDVAAIIASPCARTTMTANAVAGRHNLDVVFDDGLRERHFGVWEGLYFHQIEERYPDAYHEWKCNQAAYAPEGGESVFNLLDRVKPVVADAVQIYRGQTIVVVAHVGPIRALLCDALNMPLAEYRRLGVDPASVTCVDYGKSQNNLIFMNFIRDRSCS